MDILSTLKAAQGYGNDALDFGISQTDPNSTSPPEQILAMAMRAMRGKPAAAAKQPSANAQRRRIAEARNFAIARAAVARPAPPAPAPAPAPAAGQEAAPDAGSPVASNVTTPAPGGMPPDMPMPGQDVQMPQMPQAQQPPEQDFDSMMNQLKQSRLSMPGDAAAANMASKQQFMQWLELQKAKQIAHSQAQAAPFMRDPKALMASEDAAYRKFIGPNMNAGKIDPNYTPYNAADARKAQIAAQYADTGDDTARHAKLAAAMNIRAAQATKAQSDPTSRLRAGNAAAIRDEERKAGIERRTAKAAEIKKKNFQNAANRGVLSEAALAQAMKDYGIVNPADLRVQRQAVLNQSRLRQPPLPRPSQPSKIDELIRLYGPEEAKRRIDAALGYGV